MSQSRTGGLRLTCALVILISCIGCDQATKHLATQALQHAPPQSYLGDTLRLEYALNSGGFLSLGSGLAEPFRTWIFIGFNVCMMFGLAVYLAINRQLPWTFFIAATFIIAGGVGNLIDRILNQGLVTDFINVGIGPLRTGIFNVADMAVTFGAIAIALQLWQQKAAEPDGAAALSAEAAPPSKPPPTV